MWSLFFVLLSYLDGDAVARALEADGKEREQAASPSCAQVSAAGAHLLYRVSDGAELVRAAVGPAGRLLDCSVTAAHGQVSAFVRECATLGARRARVEAPFARADEARAACRRFQEARVEAEAARSRGRSRRGFTYPGTLWCGVGNMAERYEQLGRFADTDSCCRVHDHCPHVIHAFSSKYGYTNFKWHSICHCDCDSALKACLRSVNDTSSRVVGQAFFNVIGVPCFDLRYEERCAERHWYGMCKRHEQVPIAVLREATPYDFGGIDVIDELTLNASTAASKVAEEDAVKVPATTAASSSQSSNGGATAATGKAPRSDRKTKKKKKTKKKPRGKARKRGRMAAAAAAMWRSAGGEKTLRNAIRQARPRGQSSSKARRVFGGGGGGGELGLEGKDESSNEVMRDEPAAAAADTSLPATQEAGADRKSPVEPDATATPAMATNASTTAAATTRTNGKQRKGKSEKRRTHRPRSEQPAATPAEALAASTTGATVSPPAVTAAVQGKGSTKGGGGAERKNGKTFGAASAPPPPSFAALLAITQHSSPPPPPPPSSSAAGPDATLLAVLQLSPPPPLPPSSVSKGRRRATALGGRKRRRKTLTGAAQSPLRLLPPTATEDTRPLTPTARPVTSDPVRWTLERARAQFARKKRRKAAAAALRRRSTL
ncbi:unnamed protein product [Ophioblennius macclurei]